MQRSYIPSSWIAFGYFVVPEQHFVRDPMKEQLPALYFLFPAHTKILTVDVVSPTSILRAPLHSKDYADMSVDVSG